MVHVRVNFIGLFLFVVVAELSVTVVETILSDFRSWQTVGIVRRIIKWKV